MYSGVFIRFQYMLFENNGWNKIAYFVYHGQQKYIALLPPWLGRKIRSYRGRIVRYRLLDQSMTKKYGMTFHEFEKNNIVKERDFSWQLESNAMEWEHAVEGIRYADEVLKKILTQ